MVEHRGEVGRTGSALFQAEPLSTNSEDSSQVDLAVRQSGGAQPVATPLLFSTSHSADLTHDVPTRQTHARRLITAANELLLLASELERGEDATQDADVTPPPASLADDERRWLHHARQTYRRRRSRILFFEESLFGEPAWDLLLDLFIAAKERKRVPVTSACIGSAVPTTTALRWLSLLEERGLVVREADPADARRIFVRLSTEAYAKMVAYFARAAAEGDDASEPRR
ncbi:MAG TPA: MarR family transcriptional regulator [Novosphingobium sp.]|nr:MarR family transcriptional regulator [Novosphingobium sp.]